MMPTIDRSCMAVARLGICYILLLTIMACAAMTGRTSDRPHSVHPRNGFVPDQKTAIRIAEAVWIPIYGAENISRQKPFTATLRQGHWIITGTLPRGQLGGVAVAEISKADAHIVRVSHGK